jgi:hypothetical protein
VNERQAVGNSVFAGETEHHLFRLKSRAKFNDINVRFDSSCNVPVIEDQLLGDESKCDFCPRRRTSCISDTTVIHGLVSLQRTALPDDATARKMRVAGSMLIAAKPQQDAAGRP